MRQAFIFSLRKRVEKRIRQSGREAFARLHKAKQKAAR